MGKRTGKVQDQSETKKITPDILELVERYLYVNHTRVARTGADLRLAMADLNPATRQPTGVVGIVMSHSHAKDLLRVLKGVVDGIESTEEPDNPAE